MSDTSCRLSICIPTFNPNLEYLNQLLMPLYELVKKSSIEIVISDDNSKNFSELLALLNETYPMLKVFKNLNRGMVGNWNNSIEVSSGEFFILPGQDDRIDPLKLQGLLMNLSNCEYDLVFTKQIYIDESGSSRRDPRLGLKKRYFEPSCLREFSNREIVRTILLHGNVISDPCSAIIRKSAWKRLGGFSDEFIHAPDADFWIRAEQNGEKICNSGLSLSAKRIHSSFATKMHIAQGVATHDRTELFLRYSHRLSNENELEIAKIRVYTHWFFDMIRGSKANRPAIAMTNLGLFRRMILALKYIRSEFANTTMALVSK
jgi:GT2 family glycosyltransferase